MRYRFTMAIDSFWMYSCFENIQSIHNMWKEKDKENSKLVLEILRDSFYFIENFINNIILCKLIFEMDIYEYVVIGDSFALLREIFSICYILSITTNTK